MLARLLAPTIEVSAHCDLPCGVYDPAQARIEAESVKAIIAKVADAESNGGADPWWSDGRDAPYRDACVEPNDPMVARVRRYRHGVAGRVPSVSTR